MVRSRRALVGCFWILLFSLFLFGFTLFQFNITYTREPELSIIQLIKQQNEALQLVWNVDDENNWEIWDDASFTWARWAIHVGFRHKNGFDYISQEIHIFTNPVKARITLSPSPSSVFLNKPYIPEEWDYYPKHADYFKLGCDHTPPYRSTMKCKVIMRYEEFTFVLIAPITDVRILKDLESLLSATDQYMGNHIRSSTIGIGEIRVPSSVKEVK
jgi:hypothetical protein